MKNNDFKLTTAVLPLTFAIVLLLLIQTLAVTAATLHDVTIIQVAWMGTVNSANDEWLQLHNNTGSAVNLSGWTLSAADGTPSINLSGVIPAGSDFLLERTDDTSMPQVPADLIYSGALSNDGENLSLFDDSAHLIDQVDASSGWFAGHAEAGSQ